jgi:hypothetical protein
LLSRQNLVLRALFIAAFPLEPGSCHHLREGVLGGTICSDESRCADFRVQIAMAVTASKPAFLHCRVYEKLKSLMSPALSVLEIDLVHGMLVEIVKSEDLVFIAWEIGSLRGFSAFSLACSKLTNCML